MSSVRPSIGAVRRHAAVLIAPVATLCACGSKARCQPAITRAVTPALTPAQAGSSNGTFLGDLAAHALTAQALSLDKG